MTKTSAHLTAMTKTWMLTIAKPTAVLPVGLVASAEEQTHLPELYGDKLLLTPKETTKASTLHRYSHCTSRAPLLPYLTFLFHSTFSNPYFFAVAMQRGPAGAGVADRTRKQYSKGPLSPPASDKSAPSVVRRFCSPFPARVLLPHTDARSCVLSPDTVHACVLPAPSSRWRKVVSRQ
jgi:hypothetical protein